MRTVRNSSRLLAGGLHHTPPEQAPHQGAAPGSRHPPPENRKSSRETVELWYVADRTFRSKIK